MRDLYDRSVVCGVFQHPAAARVVAAALGGMRGRVQGVGVGVAVLSSPPRVRRSGGLGWLEDGGALEALGGGVAVGELHDAAGVEVQVGLVDPPARPAVGRVVDRWVALACAGAGPSDEALAQELLGSGVVLPGTGLGVLALALLPRTRQRNLVNRVVEACWRLRGGHAIVAASSEHLVGVRDPRGLRTLFLGVVGEGTILASDPSGILAAGGEVVRELEPGELIVVDAQGVVSLRPFARAAAQPCLQERLQLASGVGAGGVSGAWEARHRVGAALAAAHPRAGDVVVASDGASRATAAGFARARDLPEVPAWMDAGSRHPVAVREAVEGKRVVLVAIGAPEGLAHRVASLWLAGAAEVHVRLSQPPRKAHCLYGVAGDEPADDVAQAWSSRLGATSVAWLSVEALVEVLGPGCTGCFGGAWPVPPEAVDQLPLFEEAAGSKGA